MSHHDKPIDYSVCVVCGAASNGGKYGDKDEVMCVPRSVPCCEACGLSGRVQKWWDAASAEIQAWPKAIQASEWPVNVINALAMVRADLRRDARIADGVCPSGCARMTPIDGSERDAECPVCGFQLHSNVPLVFISEP